MSPLCCDHSCQGRQCRQLHVYTRGTVASAQEKPAPEGGQGRGLDAGGEPWSGPCNPEHPEARQPFREDGAKVSCPQHPQTVWKEKQSLPPC